MTYQEAKQHVNELENLVATATANLKSIPTMGSPDDVKATKTAKSKLDTTVKQLEKFNAKVVRQFKKEIKIERRAKGCR